MSATVTIKNGTAGELTFTRLTQSDQGIWISEPGIPTTLKPGFPILIEKGNDPIVPFEGHWFKVDFNDSSQNLGSLYFDDPAVGQHSFKGTGPFNFAYTNDGDNYFVTITAKS